MVSTRMLEFLTYVLPYHMPRMSTNNARDIANYEEEKQTMPTVSMFSIDVVVVDILAWISCFATRIPRPLPRLWSKHFPWIFFNFPVVWFAECPCIRGNACNAGGYL